MISQHKVLGNELLIIGTKLQEYKAQIITQT